MGVATRSAQGDAVSPAVPTMIGLGRLVDLIVCDAQGQQLRITPQDEQWLAWKADTHDLVVLRLGRGADAIAKRGDARRHQAFHGSVPKKTRAMEWPVQRGVVRTLGLIESVTYSATGIHSPSKGPYHWIHQFGDRGKHGRGSASMYRSRAYLKKFMPRLDMDESGNLFVVRLCGNGFTVKDWIIG